MSRKDGTLKLSSNIEPRAAAPLDARTVVPTLADLTASGAFPYPYVGMIVSVQSEGKAYMLNALDTTVSSNWIEIGSGGETSNQTIKWEEAQRSVKRNYIEMIDKTTKDLNDDLIIESHKEGYIDITYSPSFYRGVFNISYSCFDYPNFFTFDGVSGEYKLIINFVDNNDESNNQVMENFLPMTINNGDNFDVHGQVQKSGSDYTIILYVQNRTTDQSAYITHYVNNVTDVTLYPIFLLSSIKNTSWEPATILDNIQLNEKMINTFSGTKAEWDLLTTEEKKEYDYAAFTDDSIASPDIYSTTETKTNKVWIDGKPIYRKVIDCGILPNNNSITIDHNISSIASVITLQGIAVSSSIYLPIPYVAGSPTTANDWIHLYTTKTEIGISTLFDFSAYKGYVTIEYTKTTD